MSPPPLTLIRHGAPTVVRDVPAAQWELDPAGFDDVWALRAQVERRVPRDAVWCCSPEPKAQQTAQLLTDTPVAVLPGLGEQRRDATWWPDFPARVAAAFARPELAAGPGWEPLLDCQQRLLGTVAAARADLAEGGRRPLVLVGHGTALCALEAGLRGLPLDDPAVIGRWRGLGLPDLWQV